jgi:hypothetical protein
VEEWCGLVQGSGQVTTCRRARALHQQQTERLPIVSTSPPPPLFQLSPPPTHQKPRSWAPCREGAAKFASTNHTGAAGGSRGWATRGRATTHPKPFLGVCLCAVHSLTCVGCVRRFVHCLPKSDGSRSFYRAQRDTEQFRYDIEANYLGLGAARRVFSTSRTDGSADKRATEGGRSEPRFLWGEQPPYCYARTPAQHSP